MRGAASRRAATVAALAVALVATGCDDGFLDPPPYPSPSGQSAARLRQAADRDALVALYEATSGDSWTRNDGWLSDRPLDEWFGIIVNSAGRVTGLRLAGNELEGALPAALGDLSELRSVQLHENKLTGSIPPQIGDLGRLGAVTLSDNDLSGPLPAELARLDSLRGLWLDNNGLEGPVPAGFTDLRPLFFDIAGNESLCVPPNEAFAEWVDGLLFFRGPWCGEEDVEVLRQLYKATDGENWTNSDGWLDGDHAFGWHGVETDSLGRVTGLDLSANGLAGTLPEELGRLDSLTSLDVSSNQIAGRLPEQLGELSKLTSLNLSSNHFLGSLPLSLRGTALDELRYEDTRLCVPDDAAFRAWLGSLATHEGTGEICAFASDREILVSFYEATGGDNWFSNDGWLTDAPLDEWYGVSTDDDGNVIELILWQNFLSGRIPPEFGGLDHLEVLKLSGNYFLESPLPPEFFDLLELRILLLGGTSLSGPMPPAIGRLAKLEELSWGTSGLTGPLPRELGRLTQLIFLFLEYNMLTGEIPRELGGLSELLALDLQGNQLTGPIPPELGNTSLTDLFLNHNRLSGEIPAELGGLSGLGRLQLDQNELTGSVPPELGQLTELAWLSVNGNNLEGQLPAALAKLTNLEHLLVAQNPELSGAVPASLSDLTELRRFMAGDTGLCAPQDADLLAWLNDLQESRLGRCEAATAYLTQAVQSREYPVPMVAGQPALLRVFVASEHADGERMPKVRATFHVNDVVVHTAEIASGAADIPTQVDEGSLAGSANADIPGSVIRPGLEMVIEVDPDGTLDPGLGIPPRIPETGRMAVAVTAVPDFELTLVPFLYEAEPDSAVLDITAGMASDPTGHPMLAATRTLLPINRMVVRRHDPVVSSSNDGFEHLSSVDLMREIEEGTGYWMGMRTPVTYGLLGVAYVPGWTSWSVPLSATVAHELGHNMSLLHAACGGPLGVDPLYPDPTGVIASWGYDRDKERLVSPYSPDIQSYCGGQWIGEYHRTKAMQWRVHVGDGTESGSRTRSVVVWGGLDSQGDPFLNSSFVADVPPRLPPPGTGFVVTGRTEDGSEAFSMSFDMPRMADAEGERTAFLIAVPVTWGGALETISLVGRTKSFTLDEDTDQPLTILRDPVTGQVRAILHRPMEQAMATVREPGLEALFSRGIPR